MTATRRLLMSCAVALMLTVVGQAWADEVVTVVQFDPGNCREGITPKLPPLTAADVPVPFEIQGQLVDPPDTVRRLLTSMMRSKGGVTEELRDRTVIAAGAIGYHVVGLGAKADGVATLHLAPLLMIRRIKVRIKQSILDVFKTPLFEDEVRRRLRLRAGSYLKWEPNARKCELFEEKKRIETFLQDEGYFDAEAWIEERREGTRVELRISVELGNFYTLDVDKIRINPENRSIVLPVEKDEVLKQFRHQGRCVFREFLCYGKARFTRTGHTADVEKVIKLMQSRGHPAVRVVSGPPFKNHQAKTVAFDLVIEPRRKIDVTFVGVDSALDEPLRKELTFDKAQSADDLEAENSTKAIATFLQTRGFFDVRVTWTRERFDELGLDQVTFRIDRGRVRRVKSVTFEPDDKLALYRDPRQARMRLQDAIATKPVGATARLLGARSAVTSDSLVADVGRLKLLYKRAGHRDAHVSVTASTEPHALGSAALAAALLGTDRGNDLFVRFLVDAGPPTLLSRFQVQLGDTDQLKTPDDTTLCKEILKDLAEFYATPGLAELKDPRRCIGMATNLMYREVEVIDTRDRVRDRLFTRGRPRTDVDIDVKIDKDHRATAIYRVRNTQLLAIGKIVIRGNFRTSDRVILEELKEAGFREGVPLTATALAESSRRLRNTALFDSVNVRLVDLETAAAGVNTVVEITERYDYRGGFALTAEAGGSSFNGAFVKVIPGFRNIFGHGPSLEGAFTGGLDIEDLYRRTLTRKQFALEGTLRIPSWLMRRWIFPSGYEPQVEITGFRREQDTPRFGLLKTTGLTTTMSRTWSQQRTPAHAANAKTLGIQYDYRKRDRNVDVLRPVGADDDQAQVPITTNTGAVALFAEWEHRNDRAGSLQPLAPEKGFRLEGRVSFANPFLSAYSGQDTFAKASAAASRYWLVGSNLIVRLDGRYDHGFPLGDAALLPEVERFFGGGDSTVRGYNDDRLGTEILRVGVPPLDNITQIRVLPAGGNIRALGSFDTQVRVYKLLSTAVFFDAGLITNQWSTVTIDDIRPSIGLALVRIVTPFGALALERAIPLRARLGDDPRGRWHLSFAARAQF